MSSVQRYYSPASGSRSDSGPVPELRVSLLGPPQISMGDVALSFKRRKAVALLAYLAVTGRAHGREALASLLSRESDDDDQAKNHLRNTLYALGGQVGDYLLMTRETIALNHDRPIWIDAEALHTASLAIRDPATNQDALERAVALYQGEFLAGFTVSEAPEFEKWLLQERRRLHGLMVQAVQLLLARCGEHGDDAGVLSWARRLLAVEPWNEEAYRQIMRVLARTGQRAAALAQYEVCRRVLAQELGCAPEPETQALYDRLRAAPVQLPHNLALPAPVCVGRDHALALLFERLEDPSCRLITLLGMGGSGKTCLAMQAAAHYVSPPALPDEHPFVDGVYQVRLPGIKVRGSDGTASAREMDRRLTLSIGDAIGLELGTVEDPTAQVLAWLRTRKLLLLVENGEFLQAGVAVLRAIVQTAPGVTLLVTSRERLQVPEEWVTELEGLDLPRDADDLEHAGASQLFLHHAQQVGISAPLSADDRSHIVRICQVTQGLPLALVLAARWRRGLSCGAIAAELERGIDLLVTTDRGVPARHRSIRAVLAAVWEPLTIDDQAALRRLTVFQGGFTREAAHAVAGTQLTQVLALRDLVLLSCDEHGRYVLHELMRRYAAEQLALWPDDEGQVRARHAAYYAGFVEHHAGALSQSPQARDAVTREIDNVRAAWEWAVVNRDVDLLAQMREGLIAWYELTGEYREWSQVMGRAASEMRTALAAAGWAAKRLLCSLLTDEARGWIEQGQYDRALPLLNEADGLAQASALLHLEAYTAYCHGQLLYRQGLTETARPQLEQALALARTAGVQDLEAQSLLHLGRLAVVLGEYRQGQDYCARALAVFHALGNPLGEAAVRCELGALAYEQSHFATARTYFDASVHAHRMLGYRAGERCALNGLGLLVDEWLGRYTDTDHDLALDLRIAQDLGDRQSEARALAGQGRHSLLQGDLGHARTALSQALAISQQIGAQETIGLALRGLGFVAHYEGDERQAYDFARQAVQTAQDHRHRRVERFALRLLGHSLAGFGLPTQATVVYQRALELDRTLGYWHLAVETTADLARVALAQGDTERATIWVTSVLDHLKDHRAAGTEEPVLLYLTCYLVLRVRHDPRAEELLAAGHAILLERADQFEDAARRHMFLENLPAHRDLLRMWHHGGYSGSIATMPGSDSQSEKRAHEETELAPLSMVI